MLFNKERWSTVQQRQQQKIAYENERLPLKLPVNFFWLILSVVKHLRDLFKSRFDLKVDLLFFVLLYVKNIRKKINIKKYIDSLKNGGSLLSRNTLKNAINIK